MLPWPWIRLFFSAVLLTEHLAFFHLQIFAAA